MSRGVLLKKLSPADQPAGGGLDALGEIHTRPTYAVQKIVKVGSGCVSALGDHRDRKPTGENSILETHSGKCSSVSLSSQAFFDGCATLLPADHRRMAWLRVENFRKRLKEYQDRTGKTQAEAAEELGTTYGTLRFWLSGTRPPKNENLQRAVVVFGNGCSITEFIDDPGGVPPGIDPTEWAETSERTRVLASAMFQDLRALPEDEQQIYYELWKKGQEIGRARLASEAKEKLQAEPESEKTKKPQRR